MAQSYSLFCMGNPLLDMQVTNGEALLEKYKLKANDAILAGEDQAGIYEEILKYPITYVAGGASQNAARGAAYVLPPNSVVFTGCVGDDDFAEQLRRANAKEGLTDAYLVKKGEKTGACAVVITGVHRSLVTDLRAAEKFEFSHLQSDAVKPLIEGAKFFYVEGYFLTHGTESVEYVAKKASEAGKVFALNLSAPFIPIAFKAQVDKILPFTDIIICNESEASAWASSNGLPDPDNLEAVAVALALVPKANLSRARIAIITHGAEATIVCNAAEKNDDNTPKVKTFAVDKIAADQIVDTNAAGDGFAGGVMGALVAGKSIDEAVLIGHKMGAMVIQQVGPQYKWPKVQIF